MSRISLSTPCPIGSTNSSIPRNLSTFSDIVDDTCTGEIDYTRAIQPNAITAPPRRPRAAGRRRQKGMDFSILEDLREDEGLKTSTAATGGSVLLARPAQKIPLQGLKEKAQPYQQTEDVALMRRHEDDGRRRTIYVPSDDTTIFTIHPGAQVTEMLNDTFQIGELIEPALGFEAAQEEIKPIAPRRPRKSLAAAPRRMPMQQVAAIPNIPALDRAGVNGGKENIPPSEHHIEKSTTVLMGQDGECAENRAAVKDISTKPISYSRLQEPTAASQARRTVVVRHAVPRPRPIQHQQPRAQQSLSTVLQPMIPPPGSRLLRSAPAATSAAMSQTELRAGQTLTQISPPGASRAPGVRPSVPRDMSKNLQSFPLLSEDLSQPQLYSEDWLGQEEDALTGLINQIFVRARCERRASSDTRPTRESLLSLYNQPVIVSLHDRLHASLRYGALARPKDMPSPPNAQHDIGLRKKLINFWLHTYEEDMLLHAAEVVIGRRASVKTEMDNFSNALEASEAVLDPEKKRRTLIRFLETFFILAEDITSANATLSGNWDEGLEVLRWQKVVMRSLLLIWLLDHAKADGVCLGCLFKRTSRYKSSTALLHAFSRLMVPSIGDITRPLRHLDYYVSHVQDPLDEVQYHIKNLSVDLRDGVFLTRLAEIVLGYLETQEYRLHGTIDDADAPKLPNSTLNETRRDSTGLSQPLSQHLKMPCLGRAQKIHNIQIALDAINAHDANSNDGVIRAKDIVDGHREKTLKLLWSLVLPWALQHFIDWKDVVTDIRSCSPYEHPTKLAYNSQSQQEALLQRWAETRCRARGINVQNLTTSFGDGKAYAAILGAFECFLPASDSSSLPHVLTSKCNGPAASFRMLGGSEASINHLTTSSIPSRNTTLANLIFLAASLIPLAGRHRAATTLQRAWRRVLESRVR